MQLPIPQIPPDFIKSLPQGFRLRLRGEHQFLLVEALFCPRGHSLIVDSVKVHDEPSIKLSVRIGSSSGCIFIDSFWGSHAKLFNFVPDLTGGNSYVQASCSECQAELSEEYYCEEPGCGSGRGILLLLPGRANKIHVCARLGCPGHKLEVNALPPELLHSVSSINFFGAGADEVFGGV